MMNINLVEEFINDTKFDFINYYIKIYDLTESDEFYNVMIHDIKTGIKWSYNITKVDFNNWMVNHRITKLQKIITNVQ
jgi:hypothetical protein